jgi:hypothetical protein
MMFQKTSVGSIAAILAFLPVLTTCFAQAIADVPILVQNAAYDDRDRTHAEQAENLAAAVEKTTTGTPSYNPAAGSVNICIPFKNLSDKPIAAVTWRIDFLTATGGIEESESASSEGTFSKNALIGCSSGSPAVVAVRAPHGLPPFRVHVTAVTYEDGTVQRF